MLKEKNKVPLKQNSLKQGNLIMRTLLGYNPKYAETPFVDFHKVNTDTDIKNLNLNWREKDLPEKIRTKHVHRLHPYLGKFIPQLVEIFLRKFDPLCVCDPFVGSGTTLVEANSLGINAVGCDISEFNCLLSKVKTEKYNIQILEREIRDIISIIIPKLGSPLFCEKIEDTTNEFLTTWFSPNARKQLLFFKSLIPNYHYQDVLKIILSRAARSSRLTTHFDLDFPKSPQTEPYECYKHSRICRPTDNALQFLIRYGWDTLKRIKEFSKIRTDAEVKVFYGDSRKIEFPIIDLVITSPPYVGLIDYHEQHRYAYELLGLQTREELEIGAAYKGYSQKAKEEYIKEIGEVFLNVRQYMVKRGIMVIIVHDKNDLYKKLAPEMGFKVDTVLERHVNRRTGRRTNDFFEEVLIWRRDD